MAIRTTIRSGDAASLASPALTPMVLGCCPDGVVGQVYSFNPGDDVAGTLGGAIGSDAVYALLRQTGGIVRFTALTPTWFAAPSVTHVGTGPTVTCALTSGEPGCFDDFTIVGTVAVAGSGGAGAAIDMAYDGSTIIERLPIPAENPAVLTGKVDIQYGMGSLAAKTLIFTVPTADTVTFDAGTLPAATASLKAATATVAAPVVLTQADLLAAGIALVNAAFGAQLVFTTAGATASDAPADVVIVGTLPNGTLSGETLTLSQIAGAATSVNRYKIDASLSLSYPAADGVGATIAIGNADVYATPASIVDEFNSEATSEGLAVQARASEDSTGAIYLQLYSTSSGAAVTVTIDATSTGDALLGFTAADPQNLTGTGSTATIAIPYTGLTLTFPTGAYVKGDTYTMVCSGPRATVGAIVAGATKARANYKQAPFGFFIVAQPASTAANCAATEVALASANAEAIADPTDPTFLTSIVGAPFFTTSTTRATNNTNIATADAALLLAVGATAANKDSIATCDEYIPGSSSLRFGFFRRTAAIGWAAKRATAAKLAADVADGIIPEASLLAPDLLTYARDDATATTKLGGGSGPGFSALKSMSSGLSSVKFVPGATRAGPTSRLRFVGVYGVCLEVARLIFPFVELWEGQTDQADPSTGMLSDAAKKERGGDIDSLIRPTLLPAGGDPNCSDFTVELLDPLAGKFIDNGQIRIKVSIVPLGEIEDVFVDIVATGQGTTIEA